MSARHSPPTTPPNRPHPRLQTTTPSPSNQDVVPFKPRRTNHHAVPIHPCRTDNDAIPVQLRRTNHAAVPLQPWCRDCGSVPVRPRSGPHPLALQPPPRITNHISVGTTALSLSVDGVGTAAPGCLSRRMSARAQGHHLPLPNHLPASCAHSRTAPGRFPSTRTQATPSKLTKFPL
jgi:hypothetical protein